MLLHYFYGLQHILGIHYALDVTFIDVFVTLAFYVTTFGAFLLLVVDIVFILST